MAITSVLFHIFIILIILTIGVLPHCPHDSLPEKCCIRMLITCHIPSLTVDSKPQFCDFTDFQQFCSAGPLHFEVVVTHMEELRMDYLYK